MITSKNIRDVVEETLNNDDLYIVEVTVDLNNRIKVILDSDKTVSITDCISVNRAIEQHFDRDEDDFSLEVTSAGLGQPLVLLRQYNKLIGKKLEITVDNGLKLSGELKKVNGEYVELLEESKKRKAGTNEPLLHKLTLGNIKQAKAIITI